MKHISKLILAAVMATTLAGCALESMAANDLATDRGKAQNEQRAEKHHEKKAVAKLVEEFGTKLKLVSLLAPQDVLVKSMEEHYGKYVTGELLAKWQSNPELAPGRAVSSPWPERMECYDKNAVEKPPHMK